MAESTNKYTYVMISSTVRDLPEHREEAMDACIRQGMYPIMMEHRPTRDVDAIRESLDMVDRTEIYLGIFAFRYGYVPKGYDISITEMEYDRAVERGIPRLIFIMHKDHPLKAGDVETGEGAAKLEACKERLKAENQVNFFVSPADLRAHIINSLAHHRVRDMTAFHYVGDIPAPPEAYIAHPYTLLQTHDLIGRHAELNILTDWVARPDAEIYQARILNLVAIGGMGKSALAWKWFNQIAPNEMEPLAGRMWWSFYESDARYENFVIRALAYASGGWPRWEIERSPPPEREAQLLDALDREPFLLVLDGLERVLIAYARMDAARLDDDAIRDEHNLRKAADPRAGAFLRKLARVRESRVLVSTRLYPAELQTGAGDPLPGCYALPMTGLCDDDALALWRAFGVSGSRDELLRLFRAFDNHPLLIQALASRIARYRPAPGEFDQWRKDNPDFDPFGEPLVNVRAHVLHYALMGLDETGREVLHTLAAFRMPAGYDTLTAFLVGEGKLSPDENALDATLTELEDRGLLGWDRRANRYDLHPIVRGVTWSGLANDARQEVYGALHAHFEAVPAIEYEQIESLEDLTAAIELYNTLIGLGRYDDACDLFYERMERATLYRLSASRQRAELLEMLFPDGLDELPRVRNAGDQAWTLNALATAYHASGQPGRAAPLYRRVNAIYEEMKRDDYLSVGLGNLADALRLSGGLREAEAAARGALLVDRARGDRFQEAVSLYWLGLALAARGVADTSEAALARALRIRVQEGSTQGEGVVNAHLAQWALWLDDHVAAQEFADCAWELSHVERNERDFIRAARRQGAAALGLGDEARAEERLCHALARARAVNLVEEELPALVGLAELRRRQARPKEARECLDDVWELAERGPYPLDHADACNVLAQIERGAGDHAAAIEAATEAYRLAWCDGPPFAYHWGLEAAQAHLAALGAPEPELPPFDESNYEPLPEAEINPPDEYGG